MTELEVEILTAGFVTLLSCFSKAGAGAERFHPTYATLPNPNDSNYLNGRVNTEERPENFFHVKIPHFTASQLFRCIPASHHILPTTAATTTGQSEWEAQESRSI